MTPEMLLELKKEILQELRADFILTPKVPAAKGDRPEVLANTIKAFVCSYMNFSIDEIEGRCRKSEYTKARQIIAKIARSLGGARMSLSTIGSALRRDHAQAYYYLRTFDEECSYNKSLVFDERVIREAFIKEHGDRFKLYTLVDA